jgi:hypothetical protein
MSSIAIRIHDKFQARAARERIGPSGRRLPELAPLLATRERQGFGAAAVLGHAVAVFLNLSLWMGCFFAGALLFAEGSGRW